MPTELRKYFKIIQYYYDRGGYIAFDVYFQDYYDEKDTIIYNNKHLTLKEYVYEFISNQISDGWGENGIYLIKGMIGDDVIHAWCSTDLQAEDFKDIRRLEVLKTEGL